MGSLSKSFNRRRGNKIIGIQVIQGFLLFILFFSSLSAEIRELHHFRDIENVPQPGDWVILDIDNTLIECLSHWGHSDWFMHLIRKAETEGKDLHEVSQTINEEWKQFHSLCLFAPVEPDIAAVIKNLQKRNIALLGMTARHSIIDIPTIDSLHRLQIDFEPTAPYDEQIDFTSIDPPVRYLEGILFCGVQHKKGKVFVNIVDTLKNLGITLPKRILFVDDSFSQVSDMDSQITAYGIPIISYHYRFVEKNQKLNWNPKIAEMQYKLVGSILSDQQARVLLEKQ